MLTLLNMLNDDALEANYVMKDVAVADNESVVSLDSADDIDEEDVDLVHDTVGIKRSSETLQNEHLEPDKKQQKSKTKDTIALHRMKPNEQYEIIQKAYVRISGKNLTTLELNDGIQESHLKVCPNLGKHSLNSLPLYIRHLIPDWKLTFRKKPKIKNSPILIIVSLSAERVLQVLKYLASFKCKVAKLFARHIKIQTQEKLLASTHLPIAVGTPARIKKLIESGALSLECTKFLMIDMHYDQKQLSILDMKDTSTELMDIIQYHALPKLQQNQLKLVLY